MKQFKALFLISILCVSATMSFLPLAGPIVRKLNLQEWHAGLIVSLMGIAWLFMSRFWGKKSDIYGRRNILLIVILGFTISYFILAIFVDFAIVNPPLVIISLTIFALIRLLNGIFYSAIIPVSSALIADKTQKEQRTSFMAKYGASNGIGTIAGSIIGGALAVYGLDTPLYIGASLLLIAFLIAFFFLEKDFNKNHVIDKQNNSHTLSFFDKRIRLPMISSFLVAFASVTIQICIGFFIIDIFQVTEIEAAKIAGFIFTITGILYILSQIFVSKLSFIKPLTWLLLGSFLSMVGLIFIIVVSTQRELLFAYSLITIGFGMLIPAYMALTANSVESHEQGIAAGTVASLQGISAIIAPLLSTMLYEIKPEFPFIFSGLIFLILTLISIFYKYSEKESLNSRL